MKIGRFAPHKKKYCHTADCIEDDPNPQEHAKGCHYKEWAYTKKSMNQRLSRLLRRIEKYKKQQAKNNYAEDKLNFKIEETEKEFYKVFEDFYLEQYKKTVSYSTQFVLVKKMKFLICASFKINFYKTN